MRSPLGQRILQRLGLSRDVHEEHQTSAPVPAHADADARRDAAFAAWFGNSKAVDAQGMPMVFFHGTRTDFSVFEVGHSRAESPDAGFFFTPDPSIAALYAGCDENFPAPDIGSVMPVYLQVSNPLVHDFAGGKFGRREAIARAIAKGHDGVVLRNHDDAGGVGDQWVVFRPEQIKSVWNIGTYDAQNPDIRFSRRKDATLAPTSTIDEDVAAVRAANFAAWFAGSHAVADNGQPLPLFHGTFGEFSEFATDLGTAEGAAFFTPDPAIASTFADPNVYGHDLEDDQDGDGPVQPNVLPVFLAIREPLRVDFTAVMIDHGPEAAVRYSHSFDKMAAMVRRARDTGHDGLHILNVPDGNAVSDQWAAFYPEQIKSAFNVGTYDPAVPDIRFARDHTRRLPPTGDRSAAVAKVRDQDTYEP
jgi:hypothetical protein